MGALPEGMVECGDCLGKGSVRSIFGSFYDQNPCENCGGEGHFPCEHWEADHGQCLDCGKSLLLTKQ